jgi:hypothetical protein
MSLEDDYECFIGYGGYKEISELEPCERYKDKEAGNE